MGVHIPFRFRAAVILAVTLALLGATTVPAQAQVEPGEVSFTVTGGLEQLWVTEAPVGAQVEVARWHGQNGGIRLNHVTTLTVDEYGAALARLLEPGDYAVTIGDETVWSVGVSAVENSTPPQSFFDDQELVEGFQYIETRDGTTLSAYVVLPGPIEDGPYPTVVEYSGYDPSNPVDGLGALAGIDPTPFCGLLPILCKAPAQPGSLLAGLAGYAVVGVNVRGTGCSGGAYDFFEDMQVLDGYDVIETVAAQDWVLNNRVGTVGLSYPGISQLFIAKSHPPSLGAITPLSVYADTATGVLAPGGLLNTGFATAWADNVLRNAQPYGQGWVRTVVDQGDTQCADNQGLRGQNVDATAKARAHPFYTDEVAAPLDIRTWVGEIDVPVFLASAFQDEQTGPSFGDLLGQFDSSPSAKAVVYNGLHADGFSPQILAEWLAFLDIYIAEEVPATPPAFDLVAPILTQGIYGSSVALPESRWSDVATPTEARQQWEAEAPITIFMESGAGAAPGLPVAAWKLDAASWPPEGVEAERWFLSADGTLGDHPVDKGKTGVSIVPNPDVAATNFFGSGNIWAAVPNWDWVPQTHGEQARFQTQPLSEDAVMAGFGSVDLWLKSDATDAELEVVLSEVTPAGNEVRVQTGQLQASYRWVDQQSSTELYPVQYGRERHYRPLRPGQWTQVRIQIPAFAHTFRAGSAIRLTINTPGGDTAEWEFELDGPGAEATHVIGTGKARASSVALPVIDAMSAPTALPGCNALRGQPCRPAPPIDNVVVPD